MMEKPKNTPSQVIRVNIHNIESSTMLCPWYSFHKVRNLNQILRKHTQKKQKCRTFYSLKTSSSRENFFKNAEKLSNERYKDQLQLNALNNPPLDPGLGRTPLKDIIEATD